MFQLLQLLSPAELAGEQCCGPCRHAGAWDEDVDQIRPEFDQRFARLAEEALQPAGVLIGDDAGLDVAGQLGQDLAEGQVGVADAGLGVAVAHGDEEIGVGLLGTPGELGDEGGLAGAGFAGDEDNLALAGEDTV